MNNLSKIDEISLKNLIKIKFKWKILRSFKRLGLSSIFYVLGAFLFFACFLLNILLLDIRLIFLPAIFFFVIFILPYTIKYRKSLIKEYKNIHFILFMKINKWNTLSKGNKFIFSLVLSIFLTILFAYYIVNFEFSSITSLFFYLFFPLSLFLFSIGFILEVFNSVKLYWDRLIFKNILKFLGVVATTISLVLSRNFINLITKVDSSHFPIALSIFTLSLTPLTWMLLFIVILFLFYFLVLMLMVFRMGLSYFIFSIYSIESIIKNNEVFRFLFGFKKNIFPKSKKYSFLMWTARAIGAVIIGFSLCSLIVFIASTSSLYQTQVYSLASQGIVYSSYHSISDECKNYKSGEWIALIGNKMASIAKKNNSGYFVFETRRCE